MEFISQESIRTFSNPGVLSRQLLSPENSTSERITITEVHLEPYAMQARHTHNSSEQIWYALQGKGKLLLGENQEKEFRAGDVVRFADNEIHGLFNDSDTGFVYLSVTSPPIHFGYAYQETK